MDSKLPLETFEQVLALAMEGCKAIATHMRQVRVAQLPGPSPAFDSELRYGARFLVLQGKVAG
jgi:hypothetical protein